MVARSARRNQPILIDRVPDAMPDASAMLTRQQGALRAADGSTNFCIWAPWHKQVRLALWRQGQRSEQPLEPLGRGYFGWATSEALPEGTRYAYRLGDEAHDVPDPASRWQPEGVHAPSAVWDPAEFAWSDAGWRGRGLAELVIYELHVGAFTPEGTFDAVIPRLPALAELGVTAIEIMPVAQFPGRWGWGYDGAYWFAVQDSYGGPRALQRLVDACHAHGLAAILDVVYNHLGPEGNYLGKYGQYFSDRYRTPWGGALNYDDRHCGPVRALVLQNVRQWMADFHFDGLRLDAVHAIWDMSPRHILAEIGATAHALGEEQGRPVHIIAESNLNDVRLLEPIEQYGYGLDAQWSDDFHHCLHVLLTGETGGYYSDYTEQPQQLVDALRRTFVYSGGYSEYRQRPYGADVKEHSGERFVINAQTHDQVGNRAVGERLAELVDGPRLRLAAGLTLLAPYTPLLFMGEEYGERARFGFFCDFGDGALREAVRHGRREEFAEFDWGDNELDPLAEATFRAAQLAWSWPEETGQAGLRRLYQDLLALRRSHPALADFARREVELVSADETTLLRLRRGDGRPGRTLDAWFNLSPHEARLPAAGAAQGRTLFDSTHPRYDSPGQTAAEPGRLRPFAFVAIEPGAGRAG